MAGFDLVGNVHVSYLDLETGKRRQWQFHNLITSGGLSLMRDYLVAASPIQAPIPPSYIAVGSGTTAVAHYQTAAPGETFRTPIVQRDSSGQSAIFHGFLEPTDNPDQTIGSYGLYGGVASDELGTGTLIALALEPSPFNKNSSNSFSLDWTITVSGKL